MTVFRDIETKLKKNQSLSDTKQNIESIKEPLSILFRALAHEKRLEILSYLSVQPLELSILKELTNISKTALSNHLKMLIENNLVLRRTHGFYEVSSDGMNFFNAMLGVFQTSELYSIVRRIRQVKLYSKGYQTDRFLVKQPAKFNRATLSFVGSAKGILDSLGQKVEISDIAGYTGYAFLYNIAKGITCPSSPSRHLAFDEFVKGLTSFGWGVEYIKDMNTYPSAEIPTENDLIRAYSFFQTAKEKLSTTGRAIILWGIPIPEFGIVNGYEGNNYLVSTIRENTSDFGPEIPIRYDALEAPNRLELFSFASKIDSPKDKDKEAIQRAIAILSGKHSMENYISGTEMFNEWSRVLELGGNLVAYHGNSYMGNCVREASMYARAFLLKLSKTHKNAPYRDELKRAGEEFHTIYNNMVTFSKIFPFGLEGEITVKKLQRGAKIIQSNYRSASNALSYLQKAVKDWNK